MIDDSGGKEIGVPQQHDEDDWPLGVQQPLPPVEWATPPEKQQSSPNYENAIWTPDRHLTPFGSWIHFLRSILLDFDWNELGYLTTNVMRGADYLWSETFHNYMLHKSSKEADFFQAILKESWSASKDPYVRKPEYVKAVKIVFAQELVHSAKKKEPVDQESVHAAMLVTRSYEFVRKYGPKNAFTTEGSNAGIKQANALSRRILTAEQIDWIINNSPKITKVALAMIENLEGALLATKQSHQRDRETEDLMHSGEYVEKSASMVKDIICLVFAVKSMVRKYTFTLGGELDARILLRYPGIDLQFLSGDWKIMFEIVEMACGSEERKTLFMRIASLFLEPAMQANLELLESLTNNRPS